jgi:3-deoxy-D-manno-octulosonic-acid transferase
VFLYDIAYLIIGVVASPVLLYLLLTKPRLRDGFRRRMGFGLVPRSGDRPCLWIHGVSVGEILGARALVKELADRLPDVDIAISTTTGTGFQMAREHYGRHYLLRYPLDTSPAIRMALRAVRPTLVVLVEGEIWPNFLQYCRRWKIPVVLVNGRMTERSYRGYQRVRCLLGRCLEAVRVWCVQGREYVPRYRALGIPSDCIRVTGSLKYDALALPADVEPEAEGYRGLMGLGDAPVLVAGSTHDGEERAVLEAFAQVRATHPGLRLVLVPRHLERGAEVEALCREMGHEVIRKTALDAGARPPAGGPQPVIMLDTIGELAKVYGVATIAYVGGSLVAHGGQNLLEPAGLGKAVVIGPHTYNFRAATEMLLARDALMQVHSAAELAPAVLRLLADPDLRDGQGRRAREAVEAMRGATRRTADVVIAQLGAANAPVGASAASLA